MTQSLPYIALYVGDWLSDNVSGCSLQAQGLWLRMMFVMHKSERYGYLVSNGLSMPDEFVARKCGATLSEYQALLTELTASGVPGRTADAIIYSRRMVRDAQERQKNADRQRKHRHGESNGDVTEDVTPPSRDKSSSPSSSASASPKTRKKKAKESGAGAPPPPPGAIATKQLQPHQEFVDRFKAAYAHISEGGSYQDDKTDYIHVAELIKKHGLAAVVEKAKILAVLCNRKSAWFTKAGPADFTIAKLRSKWNEILPQSHQPSDEDAAAAALKRQEDLRARAQHV